MADSKRLRGIRSTAAILLGLAAIVAPCAGCFTQRVIERANGNHIVEPATTPYLSEKDIVDVNLLARQLQTRADPVSEFLNKSMLPAERKTLESLPSTSTNSDRTAMANILNRAISAESIYDSARFQNVNLRPRTAEHIKSGGDRARLNRLLLEDAFPSELSKMPTPKIDIDQKGDPSIYMVMPFAVAGDIVLTPLYIVGICYYWIAFDVLHEPIM